MEERGGVTPRPALLAVTAANIPHELRCVAQWVNWLLEWSKTRAAWTKVPYQSRRPSSRASSMDPSQWATFDAALAVYERQQADGIGFVIANGFVGFDVDGCRNSETGAIDPDVLALVNALDSYTEVSVRGGGIHTLLKGGPLPAGSRKGPYELYDRSRFFVVTGAQVPGTPLTVEPRPAEILALHAQIFGPTRPASTGLQSVADAAPDADAALINTHFGEEDLPRQFARLTDDEVLRHAASAANGEKFLRLWRGDLTEYGGDHSAADLALVGLLLYWAQGDTEQADRLFRLSNLSRDKWTRRADYRARTFAKAAA